MRVGHAVGLTAIVIGAAAAALVLAPAATAQQPAGTLAHVQTVATTPHVQTVATTPHVQNVVTATHQSVGDEPQGATWVSSGGTAFSLGGPRLGVSIRDVEAADVSKLKLASASGVVIEEVTKDSAAAKAGLQAGDVIVSYDGETVRSSRQFTRLVGESAAGRAVKIAVMRDGKRVDVEATPTAAEGPLANLLIDRDNIKREVERSLAEAKRGLTEAERNKTLAQRDKLLAERSKALTERSMKQVEPLLRQFRLEAQPGGSGAWSLRAPSTGNFVFEGRLAEMLSSRGRLGVTVQELTPELATYFGVKDGVLVASVRADSPAAKAGIKAGDVITTVNDKAVSDSGALVDQLRDKEGDVTIGLSRDKRAMSLKATLEKQTPAKSKVVVKRRPA